MPKKEKEDDSISDLDTSGVDRRAHSADSHLTADGIGGAVSDEIRPYDGPVQVTPGHTYDM